MLYFSTAAIVYIVINIVSFFIMVLAGKSSEGAWALFCWMIVTLPILYWGNFFTAPVVCN